MKDIFRTMCGTLENVRSVESIVGMIAGALWNLRILFAPERSGEFLDRAGSPEYPPTGIVALLHLSVRK